MQTPAQRQQEHVNFMSHTKSSKTRKRLNFILNCKGGDLYQIDNISREQHLALQINKPVFKQMQQINRDHKRANRFNTGFN